VGDNSTWVTISLKRISLVNDRIISIFVSSNKNEPMKSYKVSDVLKMLKMDGWYLYNQKGSHRQFKHPVKKRENNSKW